MGYATAVLFLLASLGVIHGLLLSGYTLLKKSRVPATLYFGGLLLALSIRIGKSIVYYFDPSVSKIVLQIGLSACLFIGPLFAFYVQASMNSTSRVGKVQKMTLGGLLLLAMVVGGLFPYSSHPDWWNDRFVLVIYCIWLLFFLWGVQQGWPLLRQLGKKKKLAARQKHLLGVMAGMTFITAMYQFAYHVSGFTYLWGALFFTFSFYYLAIREFRLVQRSTRGRIKKPTRTNGDDQASFQAIEMLMERQQLHKNPKLQLNDLASAASVPSHHLSRLLNEVYPHGFSQYVNEKRIAEAQQLMEHADHLSLEGIGYEAGFNSKSSFFGTFKKMTGQTPAQYKRERCAKEKTANMRPTL